MNYSVNISNLKMPLHWPLWLWWYFLWAALISVKGKPAVVSCLLAWRGGLPWSFILQKGHILEVTSVST